MRRAAPPKLLFPSRLRDALTLIALAAFVGCAAPSGGLPQPFVAEPPSPAEVVAANGSSSLVGSIEAPLTDAAAGLLFIADFGGGPGQSEVAESMLEWKRSGHRVDALVTAGDNVYPSGQESGFASQVETPYAPLRVPLILALGNHDVQTAGGERLLRRFGMPQPPSAHRFGPVEVFVLDSNRVDDEQARWLDDKLARSDAKMRIVVFHHPVFSCGPHGSTPTIQKRWRPVLELHRVELVVNGHDHNYQRIHQSLDGAEIVYVVTGGGGRELTGARAGCDLGEASPRRIESRHQFLSLEASSDGRFVLRSVTAGGTVFDFYEGSVNPRSEDVESRGSE